MKYLKVQCKESTSIFVIVKMCRHNVNEETEQLLKRHAFKAGSNSLKQVGGWKANSMDKIAPKLKEWKVSAFWQSKFQSHAAGNNEKNLIKQIEGIHLPNLKGLVIYQNEIETVEPLARMHLPLLEILSFRKQCINKAKNNIRRVRPLAKANYPLLKVFAFRKRGIIKRTIKLWMRKSLQR